MIQNVYEFGTNERNPWKAEEVKSRNSPTEIAGHCIPSVDLLTETDTR